MAIKIPPEQMLERFRRLHEAGKAFAFIYCARYCEQEQLPWPEWVRSAFLHPCESYLANCDVDLDTAFFGRRSRGQSDPREDGVIEQRHHAVGALARAAEMVGFPHRPSEGQQSIKQFVNGMAPKLFDFEYQDTGKIIGKQWQLERSEPDRLLFVTVAGEVSLVAQLPMTWTEESVMISGELADRERQQRSNQK